MEYDANWFEKTEEELPSPDQLVPLSQPLITAELADAFDITHPNEASNPTQTTNPQNLRTTAIPSDNPAAGSNEPAGSAGRTRLVWTLELHKRFLDAVVKLGIKNAVPRRIMAEMNVHGLTRSQVASHLQKYRSFLKRHMGPSKDARNLMDSFDPATDHLLASTPLPSQFSHQAQCYALAHPGLEGQNHGMVVGHFGSPPNGQFENPFAGWQPQQRIHGIEAQQAHTQIVTSYVQGPDFAYGDGGREALPLFPPGNNSGLFNSL